MGLCRLVSQTFKPHLEMDVLNALQFRVVQLVRLLTCPKTVPAAKMIHYFDASVDTTYDKKRRLCYTLILLSLCITVSQKRLVLLVYCDDNHAQKVVCSYSSA